MGNAKSFRDLIVWQKSHELALGVYRITKKFPHDEKFGLISQMRRAAVSIPANIAERFIKRSTKDKSNFYNIAQGSLEELKYYFILGKDLDYESDDELPVRADDVGRLLYRLLKSLS